MIGLLCAVLVVIAGVVFGKDARENKLSTKHAYLIDIVHEQRVTFATTHGVSDPVALVSAVRSSPMASLLICVAIEESSGDPVAVGSFGEQGAWQVKPSDWGAVPRDIHGQAGQAERIIRGLIIRAKGDKKEALAQYNGGTRPPSKSYRYAERILKLSKNLEVAVNYLPPNIFKESLFKI